MDDGEREGDVRVEVRLSWPREAVWDLLRVQEMLEQAERESRSHPTPREWEYICRTYPVDVHTQLVNLYDEAATLGLCVYKECDGVFFMKDKDGLFVPFAAAVAFRAVMRAHGIQEALLVTYRIVDPKDGRVLCGGPGSFVVSRAAIKHRYPPDVAKSLQDDVFIDDDHL